MNKPRSAYGQISAIYLPDGGRRD